MPSGSADVDEYLANVPDARRDALAGLRRLCRERLDGFEEAIRYGMPSYARDGVVEVAFASRKQYVSFHVLRTEVLDAHRSQLAGLDLGKGCIRYRRTDQIDVDLVASLLDATAAARGEVC